MVSAAKIPDSALYYPFINFRSESWLKRAILHWDVIWRIAPQGHESLDPPQYWETQPSDLYALEDRGIVRRYAPGPAEAAVTSVWEELIQSDGDALARDFALDLDRREAIPDGAEELPNGLLSSPIRRLRGVGWMFNPKMPPPIFDRFAALGVLVRGEERGAPHWSALDERLLDAYMTTLANQIIGERPIDTVADSAKHFRRFEQNSVDALRELLFSKLPSAHARSRVATNDSIDMIALSIDAVQPGGIDTLSLDDVLEIRDASADARHQFKHAVSAMVTELRAVRGRALDDKVTEKELQDLKRRHIEEPLAELRKAMTWRKVEAATSVVTLKSVLEPGSLGAMLLGAASLATGGAVVGVAGFAIAALNAWRVAKAKKAQQEQSPLGWLLEVERLLDARGALAKLV